MTLWHSAIFGLGAIVVFAVAYLLVSRTIDEQTNDAIEFRFHQFAAEYRRGGAAAVMELCKLRLGRAQKAYFVRLADASNGTTFLRDPDEWVDFVPSQLSTVEPKSGADWVTLEDREGTPLRIMSRRLEDGIILQVGRTLENRRELLTGFRNALIAVGGLVLVAGLPAGAFVSLRALRPVQHLTAAVQSILETGKFTARMPSRGTGDEIDELVECFNTMLVKIEGLVVGMRESLDNVAHDLRTPMTRLRNVAMAAIDADADKARCHDALGECLEESERVITMLSTLMDIAEAENGVMRLNYKTVPLQTLAEQVLDLYQHVGEDKSVSLHASVPSSLVVEADSGRLQRALCNLVDNAIKYTPAGGTVEILGSQDGETVRMEIADTGDGIPQDEQSRIWERLYRVDKSRSKRGLGLGLSLVRAIVQAHGGQVALISAPGEGSRFIIELPREHLPVAATARELSPS
jgi:signal transduction histidine kinase